MKTLRLLGISEPVLWGTRGLHPGFQWFSSSPWFPLGDRHDWTTVGYRTASYLARTPCVPFFYNLFNKGGNRRAFRLPGEGGDHFHCTVEPSPGHIRCRSVISANPALISLFVLGFPRPQTGARIPISWKRGFWGPKTPISPRPYKGWKREFSAKNPHFPCVPL